MKKIAIIGSGISGLYFANQLQNNQNYDYKIYEKRSEFDLSNGYGIQLSVNSIKLLNEIVDCKNVRQITTLGKHIAIFNDYKI